MDKDQVNKLITEAFVRLNVPSKEHQNLQTIIVNRLNELEISNIKTHSLLAVSLDLYIELHQKFNRNVRNVYTGRFQ